jgi:hypothetical protein
MEIIAGRFVYKNIVMESYRVSIGRQVRVSIGREVRVSLHGSNGRIV